MLELHVCEGRERRGREGEGREGGGKGRGDREGGDGGGRGTGEREGGEGGGREGERGEGTGEREGGREGDRREGGEESEGHEKVGRGECGAERNGGGSQTTHNHVSSVSSSLQKYEHIRFTWRQGSRTKLTHSYEVLSQDSVQTPQLMLYGIDAPLVHTTTCPLWMSYLLVSS